MDNNINFENTGRINAHEIKIGSWLLRDVNGHLQFIKDGTVYNDDYNKIPQNQGFFAMAQDGNLWLNRSLKPGWIADNFYNSVPGAFLINGGGGGAFPIYSTMRDFNDGKVGMNDVDDCYARLQISCI
jgi:hypothetical protein